MAEAILTRRSVVKNEYQLLADITVSGSAVTQVDISGLNIGKGEEIVLIADINSVSADNEIYITVNGNTTITNYWHQRLYADGTSVGGTRANMPLLIGLLNNTSGIINANLKLTNNGYFTWQSHTIRNYKATTMFLQEYYGTSTFTLVSISSLRINSSNANGLGVGSRFQLYKVGA